VAEEDMGAEERRNQGREQLKILLIYTVYESWPPVQPPCRSAVVTAIK